MSVVTMRRRDEKTHFPSPLAHLPGGRGLKPRDRQVFWHKNQLLLEGMVPMLMLTFLSLFLPKTRLVLT